MKKRTLLLFATILFCLHLIGEVVAQNDGRGLLPQELQGLEVTQNLGKSVDLSLVFTDHLGKKRRLAEFFDGKKPVLLTLNYYQCPMLCSLQLNSLVTGLVGLRNQFELQYRIVTLSFNHKEDFPLAREKRKNYLQQLGNEKADWSFLVGQKEQIRKLSETLGFRFRYIEKQKQYAHPAVIFFLTPQGKISQYLGMPYSPRDIKFALMTASQGDLGSLFDKFVMSCFVYNSTAGQYTPFAYGIMRLGGVLTIIVLASILLFFWVRERQFVEKLT